MTLRPPPIITWHKAVWLRCSMYIANNKSHWADELCVGFVRDNLSTHHCTTLCKWQHISGKKTVQGIHPCEAFIFWSLVKIIRKIFSCLGPTPHPCTDEAEIWRDGRLLYTKFHHHPRNRWNVSQPKKRQNRPITELNAVVLAARNAASNNGRGRSHILCALMRCASKTQEAFFTSAAQQRAAWPRIERIRPLPSERHSSRTCCSWPRWAASMKKTSTWRAAAAANGRE